MFFTRLFSENKAFPIQLARSPAHQSFFALNCGKRSGLVHTTRSFCVACWWKLTGAGPSFAMQGLRTWTETKPRVQRSRPHADSPFTHSLCIKGSHTFSECVKPQNLISSNQQNLSGILASDEFEEQNARKTVKSFSDHWSPGYNTLSRVGQQQRDLT